MQPYFLSLVSLLAVLGSAAAVFANDQPAIAEKPAAKRDFTPEEIASRIKDLGSETFAVREKAMKDLREAGQPAIGPLAKAAKSGELEVTLRAVRILESLLTTGTLEEFEAAERALEDLKQAPDKAASSRAETVLASMGEVREKRAIAAITALNGVVKPDPSPFRMAINGAPEGEPLMTTVVLNRRWQGGEEGLKHLENLRFLTTLYFVEGVISPEAVARLQEKLPRLKAQPRGAARLGVGSTPGPVEGGCQIGMIEKGSPADKAGLLVDDLILAFNGKRGKKEGEPLDFDRLVELLKEHDAGDKVPLLIRRDGREQVVHVVLEEWK